MLKEIISERCLEAAIKPWGYKLHTNEKTYIGKIAKGFDF